MITGSHMMDSFTFLYSGGGGRKSYTPHETGWRNLPYAVIVCAFDEEYFCEIKGSGRFTIHQNEAVVIPSGIIHKVGIGREGTLSFAHIKYTFMGGIDVMSLYDIPVTIKGEHALSIIGCIDRINEPMPDDPVLKMIRFNEACIGMLYNILNASERNERYMTAAAEFQIISPVLQFIQENFRTVSGRGELSEVMHISSTRFHYIFKEILGISPMKYVRKIRMEKACRLLETTEMTVREIADAVGYHDPFNFSRQFKKSVGECPEKYRNNRRKLYHI